MSKKLCGPGAHTGFPNSPSRRLPLRRSTGSLPTPWTPPSAGRMCTGCSPSPGCPSSSKGSWPKRTLSWRWNTASRASSCPTTEGDSWMGARPRYLLKVLWVMDELDVFQLCILRLTDWCAVRDCGHGARPDRGLSGWGNQDREWCIKIAGLGSQVCFHWPSSSVGPCVQGRTSIAVWSACTKKKKKYWIVLLSLRFPFWYQPTFTGTASVRGSFHKLLNLGKMASDLSGWGGSEGSPADLKRRVPSVHGFVRWADDQCLRVQVPNKTLFLPPHSPPGCRNVAEINRNLIQFSKF